MVRVASAPFTPDELYQAQLLSGEAVKLIELEEVTKVVPLDMIANV